jgi:protein ImuA
MGAATPQRELLEELRQRIHRIERRPARREGFLPTGRPEVDALLPGGGFPRGALVDLAGGPASGKTGLALAALREAQAEGGLAAFVDGRGELYPPAAVVLGVDLARLLIVRPGPAGRGPGARGGRRAVGRCALGARAAQAEGSPAARAGGWPAARPEGWPGARAEGWPGARADVLPGLWAAEALLASGAFAAVAIDVPLHGIAPARVEAALRRLRAAAEKGGAAGLWLGAAGAPRVAGALRVDLDALARGGHGPARPARVAARGGGAEGGGGPTGEGGGVDGSGGWHAA